MELHNGQKTVYAKNAAAWRAWLQKHGEKAAGVWLIIYHKGKGKPSVYYPEAVEEALCFGWIDSRPNKRDEESYYLFFSPRKPASGWSTVNKKRIEKLIKDSRMTAQGLAAIDRAKANGAWATLDEIEALIIPPDLEAALKKNTAAAKHFDAFPKSVKRSILNWISSAKRDDTRAKRIAETVLLATENKRAAEYKPKS